MTPNDLKFTKDHEWVRLEGTVATVGITDFAQKALGEIVFIDAPESGAAFKAGEALGAVESVKSVADFYAPVGGTVVEVNPALEDDPGAVNRDPYGSWIARLQVSSPDEADTLMNAADYDEFCRKES